MIDRLTDEKIEQLPDEVFRSTMNAKILDLEKLLEHLNELDRIEHEYGDFILVETPKPSWRNGIDFFSTYIISMHDMILFDFGVQPIYDEERDYRWITRGFPIAVDYIKEGDVGYYTGLAIR